MALEWMKASAVAAVGMKIKAAGGSPEELLSQNFRAPVCAI